VVWVRTLSAKNQQSKKFVVLPTSLIPVKQAHRNIWLKVF
jgi:hypothetical protein